MMDTWYTHPLALSRQSIWITRHAWKCLGMNCSDRFGDYTLPTESGTGRRLVSKEDARTYLEEVAFVRLQFMSGVQIDTPSMRRITVPMM